MILVETAEIATKKAYVTKMTEFPLVAKTETDKTFA